MIRYFTLASVVLLTTVPPHAKAEDSPDQRRQMIERITNDMGSPRTIELQALEIRAKIHEPQVIYIIDRAQLDVSFKEQEVHFSPRIDDPIVQNRF